MRNAEAEHYQDHADRQGEGYTRAVGVAGTAVKMNEADQQERQDQWHHPGRWLGRQGEIKRDAQAETDRQPQHPTFSLGTECCKTGFQQTPMPAAGRPLTVRGPMRPIVSCAKGRAVFSGHFLGLVALHWAGIGETTNKATIGYIGSIDQS